MAAQVALSLERERRDATLLLALCKLQKGGDLLLSQQKRVQVCLLVAVDSVRIVEVLHHFFWSGGKGETPFSVLMINKPNSFGSARLVMSELNCRGKD